MPNREDYDNEDEIEAAVQKTGVDAALLARLVAIDKKTTYVPPSVTYQPSFGCNRGLYDYYGRSYQSMYTSGYTTTDTQEYLALSPYLSLIFDQTYAKKYIFCRLLLKGQTIS
jgi:hypothetical protein